MALSLQDAHAATVAAMLTLKAQPGGGEESEWSDEWKVLVYDATGRDIISPLMRIGDLRKHGVTLHAVVSDARDGIPDVPAVYFLRPTPENVAAIAADAGARRYKAQYVYFTQPIARSTLQSLAQQMVAANASSLLARVVDRYNDFVTLGSDLFSLAQPAAFADLHRPGQGKEEVMAATHAIAQQLLCVCVTLGVVPVIQATTRGPEMAVAQQLAAMLRACVAEDGGGIARDSVFGAAHPTAASAVTGHVRVERPLLLLLDRSLDLCSMLTHPSSYGGFIADTLGLKGNRARIPPSADAGAGARGEAVDLDVRTDAFWEEFSAAPLPGAIEGNDAQLKALVAEERKLRHTAGEAETEGDTLVNTTGLASAMDGLPALLRRKAQLQSHTKLLQALMDIVTSREIPLFYEAEDTPTAARVYPLLGVPQEEVTRVKAAAKAGASPNSGVNLGTVTRGKGAFMDRVRVAAMFLLSADAAPIGAVPPSPANPSPDAPAPAWSPSDRTPAQRAFSEVAAILRASGEAHTAACAAAAAAGSGSAGGFLSGALWGGGGGGEAADEAAAGAGDDQTVDLAPPPAPAPEEVTRGIAALSYLAAHRAMAATVGGARTVRSKGTAPGSSGGGAAFWSDLTGHLSQAAAAAVAGVKGLMGLESHSLMTGIASALADGKDHPALGGGASPRGGGSSMVLDPLANTPGPTPPSARPHTDGGLIVFVVGGGTQSEYYDVHKWASRRKSSSGAAHASGPGSHGAGGGASDAPGAKYAMYGCTELLCAEQFLAQLAQLSK